MPRRATWIRLLVTVALGAAAIFALKGIPVHDVMARVASFPLYTLGIVLAASLVQIGAQASRLWLVFPRAKRPSWMSVARGFSFGQLVNMSLPARAGDVVKVVSMARDENEPVAMRTSIATATGAVLADKALDIGTMTLLGACVFGSLVRGVGPSPLHMGTIAAGVAAVLAVGWLLVRRIHPGIAAKVRAAGVALAVSIKGFRSPARLSRGVVIGCLAIGAEVVALTSLSAALGVSLNVAGAVSVLIVVCLGIAVPVSVANIGAFEAAVVLGMSPFGVSTPNAIAIGAVYHVGQFAAVALAALVFWQRDRFTASAARRQLKAS